MRSTTTRAAALAAAQLALLAGVATVTPAATATDSDISVAWPSVTSFNPDAYDYAVDVEWSGAGSVWLRTGYEDRTTLDEVVASGSHVVEVPANAPDGRMAVAVWQCPTGVWDESSCTPVVQSPALSIYRALHVSSSADVIGPNTPIPFSATPAPVNVDWTIGDAPTPFASGTAYDVSGAGPLPPIGPQPDLQQDSAYRLHATATAKGAQFGDLSAAIQPRWIRWDSVNESTVQMGVPLEFGALDERTDFFPVEDSYADTYDFRVSDDLSDIKVVVQNESGQTVFSAQKHTTAPRWDIVWSGRDEAGEVLPEGNYHATVTMTDPPGNVKIVSADVHLSRQQIVQETWRHTFTPAEALSQVEYKKCAWIRTAPRPESPGSLGLYTRNTCGGSPRASAITALFQVPVPEAFQEQYGQFRLTVEGEKAAQERFSRFNINYMGGDAPYNQVTSDQALGTPGQHVGAWLRLDPGGLPGSPHVTWEGIVNRGARYDLRSFTVELQYSVLE